MSDRIPVANPIKRISPPVKHFAEPGTGKYTFDMLWIKCGVRKREGDLVAYITDIQTSIETNEVIGHWYNYTEDPREVTCKRCLRSISRK